VALVLQGAVDEADHLWFVVDQQDLAHSVQDVKNP
jgi:hypothetical protein